MATLFQNINEGIDDPSNRFSFECKNMDLSMINGLKRIIQTDIPIPGFLGEEHPTINIIENTGPLHNEIISHRIGLIPIHLNEDEVETFNEDDYEFELNVKNETSVMINVTTNDIEITYKGVVMSPKDKQRIFPANKLTKSYILITRLRPNEHLHFTAKAIQSTARQHAGFSPVSLCSFYFIEDPKLVSQIENINILDKERAYYRNEFGDPTLVKFQIESECALSPRYLVSKAIEILMQKLDNIIYNINDLSSENIKIEETEPGYLFIIKNEDDTLGNFLQSYMHNHYIRDKKPTTQNNEVGYVGYVCPHPLENIMHLKIVIKSNQNQSQYIDLIIEHCRRTLSFLQEVKSQWLKSK